MILTVSISGKELYQQIEREKSFIKSTEKTIAVRARLSRTHTDFDKELQISLERAHSTVSSLEDQLRKSRSII